MFKFYKNKNKIKKNIIYIHGNLFSSFDKIVEIFCKYNDYAVYNLIDLLYAYSLYCVQNGLSPSSIYLLSSKLKQTRLAYFKKQIYINEQIFKKNWHKGFILEVGLKYFVNSYFFNVISKKLLKFISLKEDKNNIIIIGLDRRINHSSGYNLFYLKIIDDYETQLKNIKEKYWTLGLKTDNENAKFIMQNAQQLEQNEIFDRLRENEYFQISTVAKTKKQLMNNINEFIKKTK